MIDETRSNVEVATIYSDGTYLARNSDWHVHDSPWKARQIEKILTDNGVLPRTVAEIGCGAGEILRQLSMSIKGTSFTGYELSPQAFELCKTRESADVRFHCKDLIQDAAHFDCVLCIDVFEHVRDYMGFLEALKPKGTYKVFHIPLDLSVLSLLRSSMMAARADIGHLHYFTRETAIATLKDCGYEIIDGCYTASYTGLPSRTWIGKAAKPIYRAMHSLAPDLTVRLLGLSSYLVLAK
jgi:SAM-dependent methyltransferase